MNTFIRLILFVISLLFIALSVIMIMFPFEQFEFISIENITLLLENLKGNFIILIIGLIVLLSSIGILILIFKTSNTDKQSIRYVMKMNDYGEVKISSDTIVGLVQHVSSRFSGLKNVKVKVDILEGQLYINLNGEVMPEINIPEITRDLQMKVKEHIENCTGVNVSEVRVFITNVAIPSRNLK